jgi:transposase
MHDSLGLEPLVRGIPPIRSRRGPRRRRPGKLYADKGYDYDHLRCRLRKRGIRHRIARQGIESPRRLGRHRWVVERTASWLAGCRRLHRRYERNAERFLAFGGIAAALICHAASPNETTSQGIHRFPAVHREDRGSGVGQAASPGSGRTRCPGRAGLAAVHDRLHQPRAPKGAADGSELRPTTVRRDRKSTSSSTAKGAPVGRHLPRQSPRQPGPYPAGPPHPAHVTVHAAGPRRSCTPTRATTTATSGDG